jgi:thiamine biosynthesis lipoprotein
MAVEFRIVLYAPDEQTAKRASAAAMERIAQIDRIMSDYDPKSELCRLSDTSPAAAAAPVSDDLWRVLRRASEISADSDGAFDVSVGPLVKLWRRARRTKQLPSADALAEARKSVDYRAIEFDPRRQAVRLVKPRMQLDLGGIGKGYAADAALAVLKQHCVERALVAGSGDIAIGAPPPGKSGWRIAIAPLDDKGPPSRHVSLAHAGISTSGDALQHLKFGGRRYSHIIDPRTGLALTDHSSVTTIAPDCTTSDAVAKGVIVLGPEAGLKLIDRLPGAAAAITRQPDKKIETFLSKRFKQFETAAAAGELELKD